MLFRWTDIAVLVALFGLSKSAPAQWDERAANPDVCVGVVTDFLLCAAQIDPDAEAKCLPKIGEEVVICGGCAAASGVYCAYTYIDDQNKAEKCYEATVKKCKKAFPAKGIGK